MLESLKNKIHRMYEIKAEKNFSVNLKLLESYELKKAIDSLSDEELCNLDKEILKKEMRGYRNLYDYILKTRCCKIYPRPEDENDLELGQTWIENNNGYYDKFIPSELLLSSLPNGKMVLDLCIENNCINQSNLKVESKELVIELLKRKRLDLLTNSTIDIFKLKVNNMPLIKLLIDNGYMPSIKYIMVNEFDVFMPYSKEDILFEKIDDNSVIDYLLDSNLDFKINLIMNKDHWNELALKCIYKGRLDLIKEGPEEFYTQQINYNNQKIMLIDIFRVNKVIPEIYGKISNPNVAFSLIEDNFANFINAIELCTLDALTTPFFENLTPIEYILFSLYHANQQNMIKEVAKKLYSLNKVDSTVASIFLKYGFVLHLANANKNIGLDKDNKFLSYLYPGINIEVSDEYKDLIDNFKNLYDDGKSDKKIIENVILLFNSTILVDKMQAIRDIQALIDYKTKNNNFSLIYNPSQGSGFMHNSFNNNYDSCITLSNKNDLNALSHEWGHLIFDCYSNGEIPEQIKNLIPYNNNYFSTHKRQVDDLLNLIDIESNSLFNKIGTHIEFNAFISIEKGNIELYKNEIKEDYKKFIGTDTLIIEALKEPTFSENVILALSKTIYSKDFSNQTEDDINEYVTARLKAEFNDFSNKKFARDNAEFLCYENFLDAYYGGALGTASNNRDKKLPISAHDSSYFSSVDRQFNEMFADYVQLRKSPNGYKYINKLKEKTSDELIIAIDNFYNNLNLEKINFNNLAQK